VIGDAVFAGQAAYHQDTLQANATLDKDNSSPRLSRAR